MAHFMKMRITPSKGDMRSNKLLRLLSRRHNNMAESLKFEYNRSDRPGDLVIGLIASIVLHSLLFIGSKYWLQIFKAEEKPQPIPIEFVEVPPNQTKTPPKTSRMSTKDSVAGGKAKPKQPISAAKSAAPSVPESSASSSKNFSDSQPAEESPPELTQPTAVLPSQSPQKLQPKPPQNKVVSDTTPLVTKLRKLTVAPTTPPEPKPPQTQVVPDTTPLVTKLRKLTVAPTTPPEPKPLQTKVVPDTTPLVPKPRKLVVAPTTTPEPKPLQTKVAPTTPPNLKPHKIEQKIAIEPTTTRPLAPKITPTTMTRASTRQNLLTHHPNKNRLATKSTSFSSGTKTTLRTSSQAQSSQKTGAASRLGGPIKVSMRDYRSNYLTSAPNSNRLNRSVDGVDARQDTGIAAYLQELQQRVKQQWVPELTQTSRRTVLHFTINRSGEINGLVIAQSSGFEVTDQAALSAVKRAAPFGPLPSAYPENHIDIQFTFNINVYGELDVWGN